MKLKQTVALFKVDAVGEPSRRSVDRAPAPRQAFPDAPKLSPRPAPARTSAPARAKADTPKPRPAAAKRAPATSAPAPRAAPAGDQHDEWETF